MSNEDLDTSNPRGEKVDEDDIHSQEQSREGKEHENDWNGI